MAKTRRATRQAATAAAVQHTDARRSSWLKASPLVVLNNDAYYDRALIQPKPCTSNSKLAADQQPFSITTDDCVIVDWPSTPQRIVGLITSMWESQRTGVKSIELRRFYAPEDTPDGRKPYHGGPELIPSTLVEEYALEWVVGKVCGIVGMEIVRG
jgi:hypothetical protein